MGAAQVKPVRAPVRGWNASGALDGMKEDFAVKMDDWFPSTDGVVTRLGYTEHASGLADKVETLVEFTSPTATQLIACSGGSIYNASTASPASLGSGFSLDQWQTINKNGTTVFVNGTDAVQHYDGTTLSALTISGSGLTTTDLIDCTVYSTRAWYVEKDSSSVWYSAVDVTGGVLTEFPVGNLGISGGHLMAVDTWTRDGGDGADDLLVMIMSTGEIFVYQGDPSSTFSLIGKFTAPAPLSVRCTLRFGANLWIITRGGVVSLQAIMALGDQAVDKAITTNVKEAFRVQADTFGAQFGWQAQYYPKKEMVLFNVPIGSDTYNQYVVNTLTGAWCKFTNHNAFAWATYNGDLYFGGDTFIYKADNGYNDDGDDIEADCITAFNYLGSMAQKKQVTMVQPSLKLDGNLADNITIGSDFKTPDVPSDINIAQVSGTAWNSAWNSPWGGELEIEDNFIAVSGWGYNFALRFKTSTGAQQTSWYSTRWAFKVGGLV